MKTLFFLACLLPMAVWSQTVYNANYQALDFSDNPSTPFSGTANTVNARYLYTNVITIDGQVIDAIVTLVAIDNGVTLTALDNTIQSAKNFESEINIGNTSPLTDGGVTFRFEFIKGGTVTAPEHVALQNMMVNTYDIDGNSGKYQYQEFGGYSGFTLSSTTTLKETIQSNGLTRFKGNGKNATQGGNNITLADNWRVRANYTAMSSFTMKIGGQSGGTQAFFSMLFAPGANYTSPVNMVNPTVDPKSSATNQVTVTGTYQKETDIGSSVTINSFTVTINGIQYTTANGLSFSNGYWSVSTQFIPNGTYDVSTSVSYSNGYVLNDQTLNELVISNSSAADNVPPQILSIRRRNPLKQMVGYSDLVNRNWVEFEVGFSEDVQRVTSDDYQVSGAGGYQAIVSSISPVNASNYVVRVSSIPISNAGELMLDLLSGNNITDLSGNALSNLVPAIYEYYIITTGTLASQGIKLSGRHTRNSIELSWNQIANMPGTYVLELSYDRRNWTPVFNEQVVAGNNMGGSYNYKESQQEACYFRIRFERANRSDLFSNVLPVKLSGLAGDFSLLGNPAYQGSIRLRVESPGLFYIIDSKGAVCLKIFLNRGNQTLRFPGYRRAIYFVRSANQSVPILLR